jgi:branched-chain amino acid transport system permease protein
MMKTKRSITIVIFLIVIFAFLLPLFAEKFTLQLATRGMYLGILAMSFILLSGYVDMMSLAQMSFALMAGYVIGIGVTRYGINQFVLIPLAILGATFLAALFGSIAIRAQKIYFLMMTLALSQLFYGVAMQWVSVTRGYPGIPGIERPVIFGFSLLNARPLYYVTLMVTILCYLMLRRLVNSPFGKTLQGIRDNPKRMAALGYNVQLHRYLAIVISGTFAGIAGILIVYFTGVAAPSRANLPSSVLVVMAALVGGAGVLEGGVLGGILIAFLMSIASRLTTRYWTIVGTLFILIVMFMPNGLLGGDLPIGAWLSTSAQRFARLFSISTPAAEKKQTPSDDTPGKK